MSRFGAAGVRIAALAVWAVVAMPLAAQESGEPLAVGPWGGEGMLLLVGADRAAAEFDCAHGGTDGPIVIDRRAFEATGWIVQEGSAAGTEQRVAAVFSGRLRRDVLTVRVRYGAEPRELGPFELHQGGNARVNKCQ